MSYTDNRSSILRWPRSGGNSTWSAQQRVTTSSWWDWAVWEVPPPIIWPPEDAGCSAWSGMSPPTTRDPATAGLGSSARLISRTPVMFRCCCAPTSCGRSWLPTPDVTFIDSPAGRIVPGSLRASRQWNLPHELLDAAEITARFPNFTPHPEDIALYDP